MKGRMPVKIYLSADMEGTCGIVSWAETERSTPMDYAPYQKQMTREVAAACRGALAARRGRRTGKGRARFRPQHRPRRPAPGRAHPPRLVRRPAFDDDRFEPGKF